MIETSAAYALASWQHFDDTVSDELLRAVAGAFALVAAADGNIARSEVDRFASLMAEHSDRFSGLDYAVAEQVFRDICNAIISDPEAGKVRALACLEAIRGKPTDQELARSAAEIALAADGKDLNSEHVALQAVCDALGLPPRI
jgi:tellurite resistance protein